MNNVACSNRPFQCKLGVMCTLFLSLLSTQTAPNHMQPIYGLIRIIKVKHGRDKNVFLLPSNTFLFSLSPCSTSALWVSGLAAFEEPGHEAWYHRLPPPAHSVGRFNGSCATASSLYWLLLPQPGIGRVTRDEGKKRKEERRVTSLPRRSLLLSPQVCCELSSPPPPSFLSKPLVIPCYSPSSY